MRIHLDEIPATGLTVTMEDRAGTVCEAFEADIHEGFRVSGPIKVDMQLKKLGDKVIMTGHLDTAVRMHCSRCLVDVVQSVASDFRVVYLSQYPERLSNPPRRDVVLTEEDVGLMLFENDLIDPGQALYEETLSAIPQKPLCKDTCKGLCPNCGLNLNTDQCACESDTADSRWADLKKLKL
jgi:uncharacterized protein